MELQSGQLLCLVAFGITHTNCRSQPRSVVAAAVIGTAGTTATGVAFSAAVDEVRGAVNKIC